MAKSRMIIAHRGVAHALWAPCAMAAMAVAPCWAAAPPAARIVVQKGESPFLAIQGAADQGRAAELRVQWLASGHNLAPASESGPQITGGTVAAKTITVGVAGEYPELTFSYSAGSPGFSSADFVFVSPNGKTTYAVSAFAPYYKQTGTIRFQNASPVSLWAQPGVWQLSAATIYDIAGNKTTYDAGQLAGLFTNTAFTIVNTGMVDAVPPTIRAGKLISDTVSLSQNYPELKTQILSVDHGSGLYLGYVFIQPPGASYYYASIAPEAMPVARDWIKAYNAFNTNDPTGTWTIIGYAVCDFAQNCAGSTTVSDVVKLFGTNTFTVTP